MCIVSPSSFLLSKLYSTCGSYSQRGRHSSCSQQNAALRCQSRGLRMASLSTLSARSLTIPFSLSSLITPFNLIPSLFYQYLRDNINTIVYHSVYLQRYKLRRTTNSLTSSNCPSEIITACFRPLLPLTLGTPHP